MVNGGSGEYSGELGREGWPARSGRGGAGLRGFARAERGQRNFQAVGGLWEPPAAGIEPRVPIEWLLGLQLPVVFYFVFISHVSVYERFEHFEWPFRLRFKVGNFFFCFLYFSLEVT